MAEYVLAAYKCWLSIRVDRVYGLAEYEVWLSISVGWVCELTGYKVGWVYGLAEYKDWQGIRLAEYKAWLSIRVDSISVGREYGLTGCKCWQSINVRRAYVLEVYRHDSREYHLGSVWHPPLPLSPRSAIPDNHKISCFLRSPLPPHRPICIHNTKATPSAGYFPTMSRHGKSRYM